VEWLVATYGEVYNLRICTALGGTGAGGDHGIDHHKNWLSFPYDSTVLRLLPSLGMCGARVGVPSLGYGCGRCGGRAWRNQLRAVTTVTPPSHSEPALLGHAVARQLGRAGFAL
jgi:hypothetical protein